MPVVGLAEQGVAPSRSCPIESAVTALFLNSPEAYEVTSAFSEEVTIQNLSSYAVGGIRVGVFLFAEGADSPSYWSVLPDRYQLMAGERKSIPVTVDTSTLEGGAYELRLVAVQGDETDLLGAVLLPSDVSGVRLTKTGEQRSSAALSFTSTDATEGVIAGDIVVTNDSDTPLTDSSVLTVVTMGRVPLGAAVKDESVDSVKLVPGSARTVEVSQHYVLTKESALFAGVLTPGVFQPILTHVVAGPETDEVISWPYLSQVGLTEYPMTEKGEIVMCVRYTGAEDRVDHFTGAIGVKVSAIGEGGIFNAEVLSSEVSAKNFFQVHPQKEYKNFTLTVDLLHQQFNSAASLQDLPTESLVELLSVVDSYEYTFNCAGFDVCIGQGTEVVAGTVAQEAEIKVQPIILYGSVVVVILLFVYVILRTIPPREKTEEEEEEEESADENDQEEGEVNGSDKRE
ncbi:MAG: hypothetical protein KC877_00985 [Candidatus Kaiserbacteria bacterium]|nr:hypothetical protein [Candidatus Kaiserbacteria bacterium]MCB9816478.1 hypothetical protein [Candidatus Nomurabacteria bacterium]